jgi:hypothetical protein
VEKKPVKNYHILYDFVYMKTEIESRLVTAKGWQSRSEE